MYGLPVGPNKIDELSEIREAINGNGAVVRILVDHPDQISALEEFERKRAKPRPWSAFVKVDCGEK